MSEEKRDLSSMSPEDLQSAVQGILADPAFGKLLGELSGGAASEMPQDGEKAAPAAPPQISPEMMARLPQMMSALAPLVSGKSGGGKDGGKDGGKEGGHDKSAGDAEKRKRLLAALKPYLSSSRRDAIDSIMRVTEMTDLIGQMGIGGSDSRHPPK